jgi:glutathione synthase/RimK-type ligase-like ATP-grasp enzyme
VLILVWGLGPEKPLELVCRELGRLGVPVLLLDQHDVLACAVDLAVGAEVGGTLRTREHTVDLRTVTAAYLRPYESYRVPAVAREGPGSVAWRHAVAFENAVWCWAELTPALVVNRSQAMAANGSKPYQLEQIRRLGFAVPDTLLTTDPDQALAFWERHGTVVYKSVSGVRSIVARLRPEHRDRLADVAGCPTQFQQYVPGRDHRVHVVGGEVFPCEVVSDADDYRYPGPHAVQLKACRLPEEVEDRCRALAAALELPVAGVDLRRTPEGEWYCFEVNPAPAFAYYEEATGQPISAAVARLLAAGSPN